MEIYAAAFVAGVGSAASPCLLPLYPSFLAYLAARAERPAGRPLSALFGALVLAGVLSTMLLIAAILVIVALPLSPVLAVAVPVVDALLIVLGLLLLAGRNPFSRLASFTPPRAGGSFSGAYLYGVALGPLALPCAGPFFVAVLALSVGVADGIGRVATLVTYGLGFGLPLLVLSVLARARQQQVATWLVERHRGVEIVIGVALIAAGLFDLAINADGLRSNFGL